MAARVGLVLSGCGVMDGSEIHVAVSILNALDRRGAKPICMASNVPQTVRAKGPPPKAGGARGPQIAETDACMDGANRVVSTPCYMNNVGPWTVYQGAETMVEGVLRMAGAR